MRISTSIPTRDQTIEAIEALDLGPIKFKACCKEDGYGWSTEYADQMETAYKRFLILSAKYPHLTLAPSRDIDRFWHTHILDTRKYAEDCDATFGRFLHHFPYLGLRGEDDARAQKVAGETMRQLYRREFGEELPTAGAWCAVERDPDQTTVRQSANAWCAVERDPDQTTVRPAAQAWCAVERDPDQTTVRAAAQAWCAVERDPDQTNARASADAWCAVERDPDQTTVRGAADAWCALDRDPDQTTVRPGQRMAA
ncbi:MAG: glycine-rich domain-containing protein-like [Betaproteobacteria bacterium]|nr:MAG: glycine-rich domain-containing protein-like [Betaproteobacteria bacterium]